MTTDNPFGQDLNPGDLSDRELLVHVFTRQAFLLEEMKQMNGRVGATEKLAWIATGGLGVLTFAIVISLAVWGIVNV